VPVDLSDYVPVAERIAKLRADYPSAVLRTVQREVVEIGGVWGWVVTAECYLSPDDPLPSTGSAWEPFPGKTPYTRDSELQNAETSAWGRAIVAHLAADTTRGIASADEVRNRSDDGGGEPRRASDAQIRKLEKAIEERGLPDGVPWPDYTALSMREASALIDAVEARPREYPEPVRVTPARDATGDGASEPLPVGSQPPVADSEGTDVRPWNRRAFPFDADADAVDRYWKVVLAALPGLGPVTFLRTARDIAVERGLPVPGAIAEIVDPELVNAVRLWADARADEKGVPV